MFNALMSLFDVVFTDWNASSINGVLYNSRISSFVQSYLGPVALIASLNNALPSVGEGGGGAALPVATGLKASLTGVLKLRTAEHDELCSERAAARLERSVIDIAETIVSGVGVRRT